MRPGSHNQLTAGPLPHAPITSHLGGCFLKISPSPELYVCLCRSSIPSVGAFEWQLACSPAGTILNIGRRAIFHCWISPRPTSSDEWNPTIRRARGFFLLFSSDYKSHTVGDDVTIASQVVLVPTSPGENPFPDNIYLALPQPSAALYPKLGTSSIRHSKSHQGHLFCPYTHDSVSFPTDCILHQNAAKRERGARWPP